MLVELREFFPGEFTGPNEPPPPPPLICFYLSLFNRFFFSLSLLPSCNQCGRESKLLSKFYELELNIQGHKQLTDCITEFLKVGAAGWGLALGYS